jgi:hypothetical protein
MDSIAMGAGSGLALKPYQMLLLFKRHRQHWKLYSLASANDTTAKIFKEPCQKVTLTEVVPFRARN